MRLSPSPSCRWWVDTVEMWGSGPARAGQLIAFHMGDKTSGAVGPTEHEPRSKRGSIRSQYDSGQFLIRIRSGQHRIRA